MSGPLARALKFLLPRRKVHFPQVEQQAIDEISECGGALLVRLGRGSAMQLRFESETAASNVRFRIVPIAKATQVNGDAPWHTASEAQIQGWMRPDSAIGQWLLAKGFTTKEPAMEVPMDSSLATQARPALLSLRSKNSLSLS